MREDGHRSSKISLPLMETAPCIKKKAFLQLVMKPSPGGSVCRCIRNEPDSRHTGFSCGLNWRWALRADLMAAIFDSTAPRQRLSWPRSCNLPTSLLLSEQLITLSGLTALLRQVPEWTKCSSREKRKEKKVEKPFYSDSEGESGPTESADSGNAEGAAACLHLCPPNTFTIFTETVWVELRHNQCVFKDKACY